MPIRVLLADDHALLRAGVSSVLRGVPDIEVVAEAKNGPEALQLVAQHKPDVLLTDISMPPGMTGLDVVQRLRELKMDTRVIILSVHAEEEYVCKALQAGANGYLLKNAELSEVERAVKMVMRGETYLTPAVSQHVIADYLRRLSTPPDAAPQPLTPRQREILLHVAQGKTTKQIARTLDISVKTVETHRAQLMDRLNIHDVPGLVRYAIRTGMISAVE